MFLHAFAARYQMQCVVKKFETTTAVRAPVSLQRETVKRLLGAVDYLNCSEGSMVVIITWSPEQKRI